MSATGCSISLRDTLRRLRSLQASARERPHGQSGPQANWQSMPNRLLDVFLQTWDLGFTAFGGPAVHFQILHRRFVEGKGGREKWVDEQTYQELFAICQALPGPGSTKMIFCLALLHAGVVPAIFVFLLWSLPGAIGMLALALGIQQVNEILSLPVYALLSGLNASTVGIIALAAVQLAEKAITDRLTRIQVLVGACAGLCYNALWYFPLLMVLGGIATVLWDGWLAQAIRKTSLKWRQRSKPQTTGAETDTAATIELGNLPARPARAHQRDEVKPGQTGLRSRAGNSHQETSSTDETRPTDEQSAPQPPPVSPHAIKVRVGIVLTILFFASFIAVLVVRGVLQAPPLALDLFANMYLAGTVIFGGGPVVIPLLRSYVVDPGWVSSRDFLLGLAIIQAFPGPNFNFGVYLGALAVQKSEFPTVFGAFLGFVGIFTPGITVAVAVQSFWRVLRSKKWVVDLLRGVNATAVGLVFTAVYRLWEIGYLTAEASQGQSLALEPWWVVVAAVTYAESAWFGVSPALAIVSGAVLGLLWYAAVGR